MRNIKTMIADLKEGQDIDSLFSVRYKRAPAQYKGNTAWWFAFGASDKTGVIEVCYWGGADEARVRSVNDSFAEGDVVRVRGTVGLWKDRLKIDVNEGKGTIEKATEFDLNDFIPTTARNVDEMYAKLLKIVEEVKHEGLRKLLQSFFGDPSFAREFKKCPGAMQIHHAWTGGLLEHTLAVTKVVRIAAQEYDNVDIDLLTAGALLHDIGKMRELEVTTNIRTSEEGILRGHTVIGEEMMRERGKKTGLDEHTLTKLSHIILAHLGESEHGAPRKPMFVEAVLVYFADQMDSKARQFERIQKKTTAEGLRVYDKHLGEVYVK